MMSPEFPALTVSGLSIVKVRCMFPLLLSKRGLHGLAHICGTLHDVDAGSFHGCHFFFCRPLAASDDCAGVSHSASGGSRLTANESDHGFLHIGLDVRSSFLLGVAA